MSKAKTLARLFDTAKIDAQNTISALTLQSKAWRLCALIGLADRERGAKLAQWLLFKTVPWVDGDALEAFIKNNEESARVAGLAAGVFTSAESASLKK